MKTKRKVKDKYDISSGVTIIHMTCRYCGTNMEITSSVPELYTTEVRENYKCLICRMDPHATKQKPNTAVTAKETIVDDSSVTKPTNAELIARQLLLGGTVDEIAEAVTKQIAGDLKKIKSQVKGVVKHIKEGKIKKWTRYQIVANENNILQIRETEEPMFT